MHRGAQAAAGVGVEAQGGGVLLTDGTAATLVWHLGAVQRRPGYGAGPSWVTEQLVEAVEAGEYDLLLLTALDLPWEPDGVRDDPRGGMPPSRSITRCSRRLVILGSRPVTAGDACVFPPRYSWTGDPDDVGR